MHLGEAFVGELLEGCSDADVCGTRKRHETAVPRDGDPVLHICKET